MTGPGQEQSRRGRVPAVQTSPQVRVVLPAHLRSLAKLHGELRLTVAAPVTVAAVLDALESSHPVLRGTVRDIASGRRRSFVRLFACQEDVSHQGLDALLPAAVVEGREPLLVVGAMAGG
jgi:molybdopterin synthase sulfur carrier subunit